MREIKTLRDCDAVVTASHEEYGGLWTRWAHDSDWTCHDARRRLRWQQYTMGWWREIGKVAGRPICVSVMFAEVEGRVIAFVEGCSALVDHTMIREWIEREAGLSERAVPIVNAANFHNALR
jgi:hypothetical protein